MLAGLHYGVQKQFSFLFLKIKTLKMVESTLIFLVEDKQYF